jgi:hypothetical protein
VALTAAEIGTLLVLLITHPSTELRDQILGMGMVDGNETSYTRLGSVLETAGV